MGTVSHLEGLTCCSAGNWFDLQWCWKLVCSAKGYNRSSRGLILFTLQPLLGWYMTVCYHHYHHHHHHHQSLNREGRWGTTDDFATSFLLFSCSPPPSGTPGLSIPWCCLPTSSSVCLVFFRLSLCLAKWFLPDLMNGKHDCTTAVCVSLWWWGGLCVVQLPAGSWHRLPRW